MTLRKISISLGIALMSAITFSSCSKDDGPIPKDIGIEDVPVISTNLDKGGTADSIAFNNPAIFQGKFTVKQFFPGQPAPAKVDVVIRKNGANATVKVYKAEVTTLPASFTITAAEIVALFGAPLALKDTYDFAPDIYVDAKKYQAFPTVGLGSGQGVSGMSSVGFGEYVRYTVK